MDIELWINGVWQADIASDLPASGSIKWAIPPLPVTNQAHLRLRTSVVGIKYTADSPLFGLVNPVELLEPVDGQQLLPGSSVAVRWEATVGTQVNLRLGLPEGQWLTIADSTANDGEFLWTVPPSARWESCDTHRNDSRRFRVHRQQRNGVRTGESPGMPGTGGWLHRSLEPGYNGGLGDRLQ